jgi:hypothetical protein
MRSKSSLRLSVALFACMSTVGRAGAQEAPKGAATAEARERFDKAVRLFNENDNAAALAEFKRVYEVVPNPLVLYNIGLVYAAMGRPGEAVESLDRLLASPGTLSAERVAKARGVRDEQAARVARIEVTSTVAGAAIELDGIEIGKAPLPGPLAVPGGTHVVGAIASGYAPVRKEVTVAGRASARVALELLPLAGRLAHVFVRTHLPAANVLVDGAVVGHTPLPASISLAPGAHRIELARPGYVTARRDLELGEGATGEIAFEPDEDRAAADADVGTVALTLSQKQVMITIDGRARGAYVGSFTLARGLHRMRAERGGYFSLERDVEVAPGVVTTIPVDLYPGADTLAAYTANADAHRRWGIVGIVVGAAIIGAGGGLLAYDASQRSSAKSQYTALEADVRNATSPCAKTDPFAQCNAQITSAMNAYNAAQQRDAAAYVIGGLGLVAVGAGIALLVTGDDPHRYDKKPDGELFAGVRFAPTAWQAPHGGGLGVQGTF